MVTHVECCVRRFVVAWTLIVGLCACDDNAPSAVDEDVADTGHDVVSDVDEDIDDVTPPACPIVAAEIAIAASAGEQIVPHAAPLVDGGAWFTWYSLESGNYNVRIQHLDAAGSRTFAADGLLVSDEASDTWVMDYSLAAARNGDAIVAFSDVRTGDFDVHAYRIAQDGTFVWGDSGVGVSTTDLADATPKLVVTASGEAVFTWERWDDANGGNEVVVQRLSSGGDALWGSGVVIRGATPNIAVRPQIASVGGGEVIVVWLEAPGQMEQDRTIFARRLDVAGDAVWSADARVFDAYDIPFYTDPVVVHDGDGGVYVAWTALPDGNRLASFVQHIDADGALAMPSAGVAFSTDAGAQQVRPSLAVVGSSGGVVAVWRQMDQAQSEVGVGAQSFTSTGERRWAEGGLELVALSETNVDLAGVREMDGRAVVVYGDWPFGETNDSRILAGDFELVDEPIWAPTPICAEQSAKGHVSLSASVGCGFWTVWEDMRDDAGDIYARATHVAD